MTPRRAVRTILVATLSAVLAGLAAAQEAPPVPDRGKRLVELPTERVVGGAADAAAAERTRAPASDSDAANPKVAPGLVRWHPDLAAALAASKTSGRPVLVFQLLGNLDDEFC